MFEQPIIFNNQAIRLSFQNKHLLLEALLEDNLPRNDLPKLLQSYRHKIDNERKKQGVIALKVLSPVEVVSFDGLKKYSSTWYSAVVRLAHYHPEIEDRYFVFVGWNNTVYGAKNVIISVERNRGLAKNESLARVREKIEKGYTVDFNLTDLEIDICEKLPKLPGMEDEEEEVIVIPASLRKPAPPPKKKKKKKRKPIEKAVEVKSTSSGSISTAFDSLTKKGIPPSLTKKAKSKKNKKKKSEITPEDFVREMNKDKGRGVKRNLPEVLTKEEKKKRDLKAIMEKRKKKSKW